MAITKIQAGALPADVITTAAIDDASITHAKLHTTMDLSSKTVTLPTLSTLNTTGNVGIGTSSPKRHLHLNNPAALTTKIQITNLTTGASTDGDGFQLGISNDGTANIEQRENLDMAFATNNSERMRIDASGNVGIGTSSPEADLQIAKSSNATAGGAKLLLKPNGAYGSIVNNDDLGQIAFGAKTASIDNTDNDSVMIRGVADGTWASNDYPTRLEFWTTTDGVANPTERMRIDASGNVGIGTNNPSTMLHLSAGTTGSQGGSHAGITMTNKYDNPDNSWSIRPSRDGLSNTGLEIRDVTDNRSVMAFDGAGNVGIGTNSPVGKLSIKGSTASNENSHVTFENTQGSKVFAIGGGKSGITNNGFSIVNITDNNAPLHIDNSGRVTKPNQPAFIVRHTSATNYAGFALVTGPWTVSRNQGNHFNTSNGAFTAPVAGVYQVNLSWNNYYPNGGGHIQVKVNGAVGSGLQFDPLPTSLSPAWFTHTLAGSLYLSANDEVRLQYGSMGGHADNSDWSHWSMYLVG